MSKEGMEIYLTPGSRVLFQGRPCQVKAPLSLETALISEESTQINLLHYCPR
jgi:hypothetical protein